MDELSLWMFRSQDMSPQRSRHRRVQIRKTRVPAPSACPSLSRALSLSLLEFRITTKLKDTLHTTPHFKCKFWGLQDSPQVDCSSRRTHHTHREPPPSGHGHREGCGLKSARGRDSWQSPGEVPHVAFPSSPPHGARTQYSPNSTRGGRLTDRGSAPEPPSPVFSAGRAPLHRHD